MGDKKCLKKGEEPNSIKPEHKFKCSKCGVSAKKSKKLCKPKELE
jgi:hypothetical protein